MHGSISVSVFQDLFGVKERQARKDLRAMVDLKILQVHGGGHSALAAVCARFARVRSGSDWHS